MVFKCYNPYISVILKYSWNTVKIQYKIILLLICMLRPNIYVSIFLAMKKILESDVPCLALTPRMNKTEKEYQPHMWNYWQHGWAPAAVTGKVLFSYLWKNCNTVRAVTVWPSEREVKLIDTMAVVVVLVRPVCVWTVNLSGASQGGAPGLALTPSPTRHFILSSSDRRHLSLSLSLSLVQYNQ